ncbi:MAG: hypothetical protein F6J97_15555 [Leptolyngbya sp. SIO4C1]|nr:hypothetical protein [Leptolyngbya sp. SIO4C1]
MIFRYPVLIESASDCEQLVGHTAYVDKDKYALQDVNRLMGILVHIIAASGVKVPVA